MVRSTLKIPCTMPGRSCQAIASFVVRTSTRTLLIKPMHPRLLRAMFGSPRPHIWGPSGRVCLHCQTPRRIFFRYLCCNQMFAMPTCSLMVAACDHMILLHALPAGEWFCGMVAILVVSHVGGCQAGVKPASAQKSLLQSLL